jgi:hypothetical protein
MNVRTRGSRFGKIAWAIMLLTLLSALSSADSGLIKVSAFPSMSVADGRSTVTVSAEIRDTRGVLAPSGTQVVFSCTGGSSFREPVVKSQNGIAHAVLVAGSTPGIQRITVTALSFNATSSFDYELVADRSLLSSAKEFIEIVAATRLFYSMDQKTIGAASVDKGVSIRYRDIEIDADEVQIDVPTYEVRAKKASLKMGKIYQSPSFELVPLAGQAMPRIRQTTRFGMVEITPLAIKPPTPTQNFDHFEFKDLTETETTIAAKKAVAFPRKGIQFHKAEILLGEAKVMKLPLFQVNLYGNTPLLTEQIVNVNDNQLAVNYPHYLSLKPGETSLLRLTTGESYGRGYGANSGLFLNYERNWNRGDDMDGGLTFSGINRSDWGVGARHYQRLDDRSSMNAQIEFPAHRSVYGSGSVSRLFNGFSMSLNGSSSRSLRGLDYTSQQYSLIAEKDPTKVGKLPLRLYYGVTASALKTRSDNFAYSQQSAGVRARLQLQSQNLDKNTSLSGSFLVSKLYGTNVLSGLALVGDLSVRRALSKDASLSVGYNYTEDGFTSKFIGRQSLNAQAYYSAGRTNFSAYATRSLDLERFNYFVDASYRLSGLWRFSYAYTASRYLSDGFFDNNLTLGYLFGGREFGLTWLGRKKRFAIQILSAPID